MRKKQTAKKGVTADKELAEIIRKAQEQPGIADLMTLIEQSNEAETLAREQRDAAVVTRVVSASSTAP